MATATSSSHIGLNAVAQDWIAWAGGTTQGISYQLANLGKFKKSTDKGQCEWPSSCFTVTTVANVSGNTWRYTYTTGTAVGITPAVGQWFNVFGCTSSGNNGIFQITSVAGGAGTFDVTNASGVANSSMTGAYAGIAAVGITISACSYSSSVNTFTYSASYGGSLRVGQAIQINGMTNSTNNGWFQIASLPSGSTFTVANASGVTESGSTGYGAVFGQLQPPTVVYIGSPTTYRNRGIWATGQTYAVGDIVTYTGDGQQYYCISASAGSNVCTNTTYWNLLAYEVWQSQDSGSTYYFKIEYLSVSGTTIPGLRLGIALTTDGSGNFTGTFSSNQVLSAGAALTSTLNACYFQSGQNASPFTANGGNFWCAMWPGNTSNYGFMFGFERSKDNNGNDTNLYVTLMSLGYSSTQYQQSLLFSGVAAPQLTNIPTVYSQQNASFIVAGNAPLAPVFPMVGWWGNPMLGIGSCRAADAGNLSSITSTVYGATHTYVQFNNTYPYGPISYANAAVCMRWE